MALATLLPTAINVSTGTWVNLSADVSYNATGGEDGQGAHEARYTPSLDRPHLYEWVATFADGTQDVEREPFTPTPTP